MPQNKGYGWKPSLPDIRDYRLSFANVEVAPEVDLRTTGLLPDIWDQSQLGSCTAHGAGAAYSYDLEKQYGGDNFTPSRLFIYYNTRVIENTVNEDSGATIADAVKSINQYGCPPESDWQYDINRFTEQPPQQAFDDGKQREAVKYARVNQTVQDMQACLSTGTPFVIGFTVYDSFESDAVAANGVVPTPGRTENVLGGHCVLVVGYVSGAKLAANLKAKGLSTTNIDTSIFYWICRNSWGTSWGDAGHFYFPQGYLTNSNLSNDFWVVQAVSSPNPTPVPPQPQPEPTPPGPSTYDSNDLALWNQIHDWAFAGHIKTNKMAAKASQAWARAKNLPGSVI